MPRFPELVGDLNDPSVAGTKSETVVRRGKSWRRCKHSRSSCRCSTMAAMQNNCLGTAIQDLAFVSFARGGGREGPG